MGTMQEAITEKDRPETDFPEWEIDIIGTQVFQNSLMAEILSRNLCIPCFCRKTPDYGLIQNGGRRLILFDNQDRDSLADTISSCRPFLELLNPLYFFAIFNVRHEIKAIRREIFPKGIKGIFFVNDKVDLFIKGITCILKGDHWFPRELLNRWIQEAGRSGGTETDNFSTLTRREKEILRKIATGASNEEISQAMYISYHTVKTHLSHIYKKIYVSNRLQASLWASRNL